MNKGSFDGWTCEQREGDYGVRDCGNSLHQLFTRDREREDEGIEGIDGEKGVRGRMEKLDGYEGEGSVE